MVIGRPSEGLDGSFDADVRTAEPPDVASVAVEPPREIPFDPAADRERIRGYIALALVALFGCLIASLLLASLLGRLPTDNLEKLAAVLVSPVAGLLGAVVGFYYGEQSRRG